MQRKNIKPGRAHPVVPHRRNRLLALEARVLFDGVAVTDIPDARAVEAHAPTEALPASKDPLAVLFGDASKAPPETTTAEAAAFSATPDADTSCSTRNLTVVGRQNADPSARAMLDQCLRWAEQHLADLIESSDYRSVMMDVFGRNAANPAYDDALEQLRTQIASGSLGVKVELVADDVLYGNAACYAPVGADGTERIYINAGWLARCASADAGALVVLEEIGHAIDQRLNAGIDTPGDEGELFSYRALAAPIGQADYERITQENDHGVVEIDGRAVAVEFSVSTTNPGPFDYVDTSIDDGTFPSQTGTLKTGGNNDKIQGIWNGSGYVSSIAVTNSAGTVTLGTLSLSAGTIGKGSTTNAGSWTFTPDSAAIQGLTANELNRTVRIDAKSGQTTTSVTLTFSFYGAQDAPQGSDKTVTTFEDMTYTFSAADFGYADRDAGDTLNAVRIDTLPSSAAGTLQLGAAALSAGQTIAVSDLGSLHFVPAANVNGNALGTFTFSVRDTTGNAYAISPSTITLNITPVNDAPTVAAPASLDYTEDSAGQVLFTGTPFADIDSSSLTVTLSVTDGTIAASSGTGITLGGTATATTFSGSAADLNAYFTTAGNIRYTPALDNVATRTLTTTVSDGTASATGTTALNIAAVNDAPAVNAPSSATVSYGTGYTFAGGVIGVADVDAATLRITVSATHGTVSLAGLSGLTFTSGANATAAMAFTGTPADINAALHELVYTPESGYTGSATLSITADDLGQTGAGGAQTDAVSIALTVLPNQAPTVTLTTSTGTFTEQSGTDTGANSIALGTNAAAQISDPDSTTFESLAVAFSEADIRNAATEQLRIAGASEGGSIALDFADGTPITNVVLGGVTYSVTATVSNGTSTLTFARSDGGTMTLAEAEALLDALRYNNASDTPASGTRTFSISLGDSLGAASAAANFAVALVAVNDPPTSSDTAITMLEDTARTLTPGDFGSYADAEDDALAAVKITALPSAGGLQYLDAAGIWRAVTVGQVFTVSEIAAGRVRFVPAADANGTAYAAIGFQVFDGATYSANTYALTVNVTAVDDAPVNTVPASQSALEDQTLAIAGISVTDPDGNLASVQLGVSHGTLNVSLAAGASLVGGANGSATLQLSGTQAQLNAALATLTYRGAADYNGTDTLTVTSMDSASAPFTDNDTVAITLTAVNDQPGLTATGTGAVHVAGASGTALFTGVEASTGPADEAGQRFTRIVLNVAGIAQQSGERLAVDGTEFLIRRNVSGTTASGIGYVVNMANAGATSGTVTLTSAGGLTAAALKSLIAGIEYRYTAANMVAGDRVFTIASLTDNGGTANGGSDTVSLNIASTLAVKANEAPTLTVSSLNPDYTEASGLGTLAPPVPVFSNAVIDTVETDQTITGLTFTVRGLADGASEHVIVDGTAIALEAGSGTTANHGFSYEVTLARGTATIALTSVGMTTAAMEAVIDGITYQNVDADNPTPGPRVFTITQLKDDGGTASGGSDTATLSASSTVTVHGVNDAPIVAVPAGQTVSEDTALAVNGIGVGDPDADLASVQLAVAHGALTVDVSGGASIAGGANGSALVKLSGSEAQINAALATLSYQASADYNGSDTLTVTALDGGGLTAVESVDMIITPVADVVHDTLTTNEDTPAVANVLTGGGGASADAFSGSAALTAVTQGAHGTVTFAADGTVRYTPDSNWSGTDSFTYTVSAAGNTETGTVDVIVNAANDAPTLTVTALDPFYTEAAGVGTIASPVAVFTNAAIGTVEAGQTIAGITFTVSGVEDGASERLVVDGTAIALDFGSGVTANHGFSYVVTVLNGTANVALASSGIATTAMEAVIDGIAYQNINADHPTPGARRVVITALKDDGGTANGGSDTATLGLASTVTVEAVNDAPINTVPDAQLVAEDTPLALVGIAVEDPDADVATAELSVAHGTLSVSLAGGASMVGGANGSAMVRLSGTEAQINAALATLTYQADADYNGNDVLTITSTDAAALRTTDAVSIDVMPIPDIVDDALITNEDTAIVANVLNGAAGAGADTFSGSAVLTGVTPGARGSVSFSSDGTIRYAPDADWFGTDRFTYTVSAGGGTETGTITVTVNAVNDAPTLTATPLDPCYAEAAGLNTVAAAVPLFSNASVTPVESDQGLTGFSFTVSGLADGASEYVIVDGTAIALQPGSGFTTGNAFFFYTVAVTDGTATISLTSAGITPSAMEAVIDGIMYRNAEADDPTPGARVFTITQIRDGGGTAFGGADTAALSISSTVTVLAVDDAPIIAVPAGQSFAEDTARAVNGIDVSDPDGDLASVQLSVAHGTLHMTIASGASILDGANGTGSITLAGTQSQINATLATLTYRAMPDYNGVDTLTVVAIDSSGLSASDSVAVTVTPVADVVNDALATNEDTVVVANVLTGTGGAGADGFVGSRVLSGVGPAVYGTVSFDADGTVRYTPPADWSGTDTFAYTVVAGGTTEAGTVSVVVAPVNDAPTITVTPLDSAYFEAPGVGALADPVPIFAAAAAATGEPEQAIRELVLSVNGLKDGAHERVTIDGTSMALDADATGITAAHGLAYSVVVGNALATITLTDTRIAPQTVEGIIVGMTYQNTSRDTPTPGPRNFTIVRIRDDGGTAHGGVDASSPLLQSTISVVGVPDAPSIVVPGAQMVPEDAALAIGSIILADVDRDLASLSLSVTHGVLTVDTSTGVAFASGANGSASLTLAGNAAQINHALATLTYRPAADYNGQDTLTLVASDATGLTTATSVPVSITPVADVVDDTLGGVQDTPVVANVLTGSGGASADDFQGAPALSAVGPAAHGSVTFDADGTVRYTPHAGWAGTDTFIYTATSGGTAETGTVTVNIAAAAVAAPAGPATPTPPSGGFPLVGPADSPQIRPFEYQPPVPASTSRASVWPLLDYPLPPRTSTVDRRPMVEATRSTRTDVSNREYDLGKRFAVSAVAASAPQRNAGDAERGFPVVRVPVLSATIRGAGWSIDDVGSVGIAALFVYHGVRDVVVAPGEGFDIRIPPDAFAHTDPTAVVRLDAAMLDGDTLPDWLHFDRAAGRFIGIAPTGVD
ncbi:MAG: tandem-95 repeat protein, partial [Rhodospirillaceae bacterium]